MSHPSHKLKAYCADVRKPLIFCELCGKDESEGLDAPCNLTFYVDNKADTNHTKFVSGLP